MIVLITPELDTSPAKLLARLRGRVVSAAIAYPEVLHVEVSDEHGRLWRLATQDASWSPSDASVLVGQALRDVHVDGTTGTLTCRLDDGALVVTPTPDAGPDDPPGWELLTPDGVALEFGPGPRWQIADSDAVA